jgi:hypothetical protein
LNGPDSGHIIAQFFCSLQCSFDPDNLDLSGGNLSGRFAVTSRGQQAALVAGQHASKNRDRTFLWLRVRTASEKTRRASRVQHRARRSSSTSELTAALDRHPSYGGGYRNRVRVESAVHSKLPAGG